MKTQLKLIKIMTLPKTENNKIKNLNNKWPKKGKMVLHLIDSDDKNKFEFLFRNNLI